MDATQFAYWCQGFAEVAGHAPTAQQWEIIKEHLNLVFNKQATKSFKEQITLNPESAQVSGLFPSEDNSGKIFITISRVPHFNAKSYSCYRGDDDKRLQGQLLTQLGVPSSPDKTYLLVDNTLNPRETDMNHLTGSSTHLVQPGRTYGLYNVGLGPSLYC